MRMKIASISDLHASIHKGKKVFDNLFRTLDHFFELCKERGITYVIIPGDIFEYKDKVSPLVLIPLYRYLKQKAKDFHITIIPGNHDTLTRDSVEINLNIVFDTFIEVVNEYEVEEHEKFAIHKLPYVPDYKIQDIKIQPVPGKYNVLFTHLCLHEMWHGHEDVNFVITPEFFIDQGIDQIYSGHIHTHADFGNMVYISSPNMSNYGEIADTGRFGFMFMDLEKRTHEFVPNPFSPSFVKIKLGSDTMVEILKMRDSFITLIIDREIKNEMLIKLLTNLRQKNYSVEVEYMIEKRDDKITIMKDWEETTSVTPENIDAMYLDYTGIKDKDEYLNHIKEVCK